MATSAAAALKLGAPFLPAIISIHEFSVSSFMKLRLIPRSGLQLLNRFDGVLDIAFPVAVSFLCLDQRTPAFLTLLIWLIFRLIRQLSRYPLSLVFLLLLGAQAGQFVLERDLQPSSSSDPLVIALGCVAMLGRSAQQWRSTLCWLALCLLPLSIWASGQDLSLPLDLPVGGLNRLGFLLGLLQLSAWAATWMSSSWWLRCGFGSLVVLALPMSFHNGSRVALWAPLLSLLLSGCIMLLFLQPQPGLGRLWSFLLRCRRSLLVGVLIIACSGGMLVAWHWYLSPASSGQLNGLSDRGRIETASCWARQPFRRGGEKLLLGLGYNEAVQKRCTAKQLSALQAMQRPEGLPHAHNLFAQIFAENGLLGLASLALVLWLLLQRLWLVVGRELMLGSAGLGLLYSLPLLLYFLMNGFVSSFQLFLMSNQLLIGLGIASLWPSSLSTDPSE